MGTNDERAREALKSLSIPEKLLLVQDLWDEIARSPQPIDTTPAEREELERRMRDHEKNPEDTTTWEDLRRELEGPQ